MQASQQVHAAALHLPQEDAAREVDAWLRRKFAGDIKEIELVLREDLDLVSSCPPAAGRAPLACTLRAPGRLRQLA
jgi:hypothetical protein